MKDRVRAGLPAGIAGAVLGALVGLAPAGCGRQPPTPPDVNVVLMVIDTLRADRLGCYGYHRNTSPTIDRLAARGTRFSRAHAQSAWTGPSMVSMLLSRYVGADFVRLPPGTTLAERLREAGYKTVGFQDNRLLDPETGFDRGFDVYEIEPPPERALEAFAPDPRPLFLYFHFIEPHDPYRPMDMYDVFDPEPVDEDTRRSFTEFLRSVTPDADFEPELESVLAHVSEQRSLYDGDVLQADGRVRFVIRALAASGRLENTLIILASDHGECLWQNREANASFALQDPSDVFHRFKKTHNTVLFEPLTHTPLIFSGPGVPAGVVVDALVENVDIVPTVLDLIGLPVPGDVDGTSLLLPMRRAVQGTRSIGKARTFANTKLFTSVLSEAGLKVIVPWDLGGPDEIQLFDLRADPREQRSLPLEGSEYERLRAQVDAFRREALKPQAGEDIVDDVVRERLRELGYVR